MRARWPSAWPARSRIGLAAFPGEKQSEEARPGACATDIRPLRGRCLHDQHGPRRALASARGWRLAAAKAPLKESLAFAMPARPGLGRGLDADGPFLRLGHHRHRSRLAGPKGRARSLAALRVHGLAGLRRRALGRTARFGRRGRGRT